MSAAGRCRGRRERGGATVLAAAVVGVVVLVLSGALLVVSVLHDVHRARAAADLAALAAAARLVTGSAPDCSEGSSVARANGATLSRCEVLADGSVEVAVTVSLRVAGGLAGLPSHATARARAGVVPPAGQGVLRVRATGCAPSPQGTAHRWGALRRLGCRPSAVGARVAPGVVIGAVGDLAPGVGVGAVVSHDGRVRTRVLTTSVVEELAFALGEVRLQPAFLLQPSSLRRSNGLLRLEPAALAATQATSQERPAEPEERDDDHACDEEGERREAERPTEDADVDGVGQLRRSGEQQHACDDRKDDEDHTEKDHVPDPSDATPPTAAEERVTCRDW